MKVTREVAVAAPPDAVWALLWDVTRMVECVPGCVEARELEPKRRYAARMVQKVGPIRLALPLDVEIVEAEAPRHIRLRARGRDPLVGSEVSLQVALDCAAREDGTALSIDADAQVLGKLGALGHGVIQRKAEEAVDEFAARISRAATGPSGAGSPPAP